MKVLLNLSLGVSNVCYPFFADFALAAICNKRSVFAFRGGCFTSQTLNYKLPAEIGDTLIMFIEVAVITLSYESCYRLIQIREKVVIGCLDCGKACDLNLHLFESQHYKFNLNYVICITCVDAFRFLGKGKKNVEYSTLYAPSPTWVCVKLLVITVYPPPPKKKKLNLLKLKLCTSKSSYGRFCL